MRFSKWFLVIVSLFVLASCDSGAQANPPEEPFDILEQGTTVPLSTGQGLSVGRRINWGLETRSLAESYAYSVTSNDLKGYPFVTMTVIAPKKAKDFWDVAASVKGTEWNAGDETSAWTTTLTGATTVRDTIIVSNVGLAEPMKMVKTLKALGGSAKLKEIVAVDLQTFVLRDTSDKLWNIETQKPLTKAEVTKAKKVYDDIYAANNTPEVAAMMKKQWADLLGEHSPSEIGGQGLGSFLTGLTAEDGSLDLALVAQAMDTQSGDLSVQTVNKPTKSCFLFICQGIRSGTLPIASNVNEGGYYQSPSRFGRSGTFNFIGCIDNTTGADVKVAALGCAPTTFVGLMDWYVTKKGLRLYGTSSVSTIRSNMTAPTGLRGRPEIANYMGSCWNGGGVQTTGYGFRDGAKNFLKAQGSSLKVVSNVSHYAGNVTSAPAKAAILIKHIGETNTPVIAEYFTGFLEGHFSPVVDYAVYDSGKNGLNIRTVGDLKGEASFPLKPDYTWYSLSGTWGTERGVFALE